MINLFVLFVFALFLWTSSTLMIKGTHQEAIKNEVNNIRESLKYLFSSLTALLTLLMKDSIYSAKDNDFPSLKSNVIDLLKLEKKETEEAA